MTDVSLLKNRGSEASTSGRSNATEPIYRCRLRCGGIRRRRTAILAFKTSTEELADDWETYWVQGDGPAVPFETEIQKFSQDDPSEEAANNTQRMPKRLPAEMRCFDSAAIFLQAGSGGRGCVAFHREKFVPRGGPSGGNGGRGGHIWAVVDEGLNSLTTFRRQLHFRAKPGLSGAGSSRHGAHGEDMEIPVPRGTVIRQKDAQSGDPPIAELLTPGSRALLAVGGRGGRGNASFKTGNNNAPQMAENGEQGEQFWAAVELKLVADVGIIGVPNAGKSTLLGALTRAKPKIANYQFTTLVPNLGVCELDYRTVVFADVPGLLEGAHSGVGLGHEFLRHCQRARVLVHIIDGSSPDPLGDYQAIITELELFDPCLAAKPQVIAYNKMDMPDSSDYWEDVRDQLIKKGTPAEDILSISAATGLGIIELVRRLHRVLDDLPEETTQATDALNREAAPSYVNDERIDNFTVKADLATRTFHVGGDALERFAQMTDWTYFESLLRVQKVLEATGVNKELKKQGIVEGDTVVIGEIQLEWSDDQSQGALYGRFLDERKAKGLGQRGSARWPHAS